MLKKRSITQKDVVLRYIKYLFKGHTVLIFKIKTNIVIIEELA